MIILIIDSTNKMSDCYSQCDALSFSGLVLKLIHSLSYACMPELFEVKLLSQIGAAVFALSNQFLSGSSPAYRANPFDSAKVGQMHFFPAPFRLLH